jgi:Mn-dependent DtxR family transcriptional regulator
MTLDDSTLDAIAHRVVDVLIARQDARKGKRTITQADAARELGVSPRTVARMIGDGRLRRMGRGVDVQSLRRIQEEGHHAR